MPDQEGRSYFISGLRNAAEEMRGDEVIHSELRPSGLHAGIMLPLVVYPYLLAEAVARRGVTPRFRYTVTLDDWVADNLSFPRGLPLNFTPQGRTFQNQDDPFGCCAGIVDHWEAQVWDAVSVISAHFPEVKIEILRTSRIRLLMGFLDTVRIALGGARTIRRLLVETVGGPILDDPLQFAGAVCRACRSIDGETQYAAGDRLSYQCYDCGNEQTQLLPDADLWLFVHVLGAAKFAGLRPNVWFFGGDGARDRSVDFLDRMVEFTTGASPAMHHVFTPLLLGRNGQKMGRGAGNAEDVPLERLLQLARDADELLLPLQRGQM